MPAPFVVIGAAGIVLAKGAAFVWFSSRATSPLSVDWRKEFLTHSESSIDQLEKYKLADAERLGSLRQDMKLLRRHASRGWSKTEVFDAAWRVSSYLGWKHTTTGLAGALDLAGNYANRAFDAIDKTLDNWVASIFPHHVPPKDAPPTS